MIQTINITTSQDPWAIGHGIVQGKFQGNYRCCHVVELLILEVILWDTGLLETEQDFLTVFFISVTGSKNTLINTMFKF